MARLADGTLVLQYLHRYPDDLAHTGIRARVSDDDGATWGDETYVISQGEGDDPNTGSSYPGTIAGGTHGVITVCANTVAGRTRLEAVHWRPEAASRMTGFVNSLGLRMIPVAGGRFDAWTPSMARYTAQVSAGERPEAAFGQNRPHVAIPVEIGPYCLSQFPVTNALYRRFVEETGHRQPSGELITFHWEPIAETAPWEHPDFAGDDLPVTGVLDEDACAFCEWLSEREGRTYRLPTIHEHECATRAGTDTLYHWGDYPDTRRMNYGVSMVGHPTPVGSYPANPWGFHDLLGNVWEICADGDGSLTRGGAFNSPQHMTGADVFGSFKYGELRLLSVGFRVACDAEGIGDPEPDPARAVDKDRPAVDLHTITAARPSGPDVPELDITVGDRIDLGPLPGNAAQLIVTRSGTMILCDRRSTDGGTDLGAGPSVERRRRLRPAPRRHRHAGRRSGSLRRSS